MELNTLKRTLKTGEELSIRSLSALDAEKALAFMKMGYKDSDYLACYPEEFTLSMAQEEAFLEKQREDNSSLQMGAFIGENLVGMAHLSALSGRIKLKHRAKFSISVSTEYHRKGIASALMDVSIKEAREMGFTQLELEVVTENKKAISLYENFGFKKVGELPNGMKLKDGKSLSLDIMILIL